MKKFIKNVLYVLYAIQKKIYIYVNFVIINVIKNVEILQEFKKKKKIIEEKKILLVIADLN